MSRLALVVVFAACGSSTPASRSAAKGPPPPPAPTSCTDLGVILRGPVDTDSGGAAAREAAITGACKRDSWSAKVIGCVGSSRQPAQCLDKLTAPQRQSYQTSLDAWAAQFGGGTYGGEQYGGSDVGMHTECSDVTHDPSKFPPALGATSSEREWDVAARVPVIAHSCEAGGWEELTKVCLDSASDPVAVEACMRSEPAAPALLAELTEIDEVADKIAAAKKQPKSITCAKVVAAYYADAKWKDKLADAKAASRTKQIAGSRAAMKKACADDSWTDTVRACLVVDGGDRCFPHSTASAWGFPALAAVEPPSNVPPECAQYTVNVDKLMKCKTIPSAARDAMHTAYQQAVAAWAAIPFDQRATLASSCKPSADAIEQVGKSASCSGF